MRDRHRGGSMAHMDDGVETNKNNCNNWVIM
jgi:hypothetical protein